MSSPAEPTFNERNIAEFRATGGRLAAFGDAPVLLLHTVGARSGQPRVNPMMYRPHRDDPAVLHVFASNAGRPDNPAWYHNLLAGPEVVVEIGRDCVPATAHVLPEAERSTVYREQAREYPGFADYQAATDRAIPVVALRLHRERSRT